MPKFPDRWFDYTNVGEVITGTRIITFKVPLKEAFFSNKNKVPETSRFTPTTLLETMQSKGLNLGLVIDLTYTDRYYSPEEFTRQGILYKKIFVPGHIIPEQSILDEFYDAIDRFLESSEKDSLIGVHCTHGVNRTGYIVCRYMVEHLGKKATEALEAYGQARGYPVERENYIHDLMVRAGEAVEKETNDEDPSESKDSKSKEHNSCDINQHDFRDGKDNKKIYDSHAPGSHNKHQGSSKGEHHWDKNGYSRGQGNSEGQGHSFDRCHALGQGRSPAQWNSWGSPAQWSARPDSYDYPPPSINEGNPRNNGYYRNDQWNGYSGRNDWRSDDYANNGRGQWYSNSGRGQGYSNNGRGQGYSNYSRGRRQYNRNSYPYRNDGNSYNAPRWNNRRFDRSDDGCDIRSTSKAFRCEGIQDACDRKAISRQHSDLTAGHRTKPYSVKSST